MKPEDHARVLIDELLVAAGWPICDMAQVNIHSAQGVAIREFPLNPGHGFADCLLCLNGKASGVIEAKKEGVPLKWVEVQSERYAQGLPAWRRPLPFLFESTGVDTQFTNGLDPHHRSRRCLLSTGPKCFCIGSGWPCQPRPTSSQRAACPRVVGDNDVKQLDGKGRVVANGLGVFEQALQQRLKVVFRARVVEEIFRKNGRVKNGRSSV